MEDTKVMTLEEVQKILEYIPVSMMEAYKIQVDKFRQGQGYDIDINLPAFVNFEANEHFKIEETSACIHLLNNKVCVILWKARVMMHVTVY